MCVCVAWQLFSPSPVADLFVLAEPNKSLNKQTNHNLLLLITVACRTTRTNTVVLNISTDVIIFGTRPPDSYLRPDHSCADIQYNSTTSSVLVYNSSTSNSNKPQQIMICMFIQ